MQVVGGGKKKGRVKSEVAISVSGEHLHNPHINTLPVVEMNQLENTNSQINHVDTMDLFVRKL